MKFTKIFASLFLHLLLASGLVSAGLLPRAGRGSPGRSRPSSPSRPPSPVRPSRPPSNNPPPNRPNPPNNPPPSPGRPQNGGIVRVEMDELPKTALPNQEIITDGLSTCVSISIIGTPTNPNGPNKALIHLGSESLAGLGDGARLADIFTLADTMRLKQGSIRVTVAHASSNYMEVAFQNDRIFRQRIIAAQNAHPNIDVKASMQTALELTVREAKLAARNYVRQHGGAFTAQVLQEPFPDIIEAGRPSEHSVKADGKETLQGKTIHRKFP